MNVDAPEMVAWAEREMDRHLPSLVFTLGEMRPCVDCGEDWPCAVYRDAESVVTASPEI